MIDQSETSSSWRDELLRLLGSIAGVLGLGSAVVSISGFFVLRANADLLGLATFIHHSVSDYFYVGAAFIIQTFFLAIEVIVSDLTWLKWIIILGITLYMLLQFFAYPAAAMNRIASQIKEFFQIAVVRWIVILVAWYVVYHSVLLLLPEASASNLLFPNGDVSQASRRGNEISLLGLRAAYKSQIQALIFSLLITWLLTWIMRFRSNAAQPKPIKAFWWVTSEESEKESTALMGGSVVRSDSEPSPLPAPRLQSILITAGRWAVYLFLLLGFILLPISYGQKIYSNDFNKVCVILDQKVQDTFPRSDNLWLIREDEESYTIYYGDNQEVRIIPKKDVVTISIRERINVFSPSNQAADSLRCGVNTPVPIPSPMLKP